MQFESTPRPDSITFIYIRSVPTSRILFDTRSPSFFPNSAVHKRRRYRLNNRVLPFGFETTPAKVYKAASQFDSSECIVLDYSETSFVARWVRDEIREIAPGVYLGKT